MGRSTTFQRMPLGAHRLTVVDDGGFRLDGGAMFGVVPRVLWERKKAPDEANRIQMVTNCILIERGDDLVLVDTGIGDKNDERFRAQFALEDGATRLPEQIVQAGYELGDVTHVLLTHLHFDHCGWNTRRDGDRLLPTFPKARYWINRGEVEHARRPNARDRASYDPRHWEPLFEAGVVELFGEAGSPIDGVVAKRVPGHNADMCIVLIDGGAPSEGPRPSSERASKAVIWADLVPTTAHVPYPWIMGYDLYPLQTLANKERWIPRAASEGWLSIFTHDADHVFGRLVERKPGRYEAEPVASDA